MHLIASDMCHWRVMHVFEDYSLLMKGRRLWSNGRAILELVGVSISSREPMLQRRSRGGLAQRKSVIHRQKYEKCHPIRLET